MKGIILISVFLLASCATNFRTDPSMIGVTVEAPSSRCGTSDKEVRAILHIQNRDQANFKIGIWGSAGPSYEISWLSYDVLDNSGNVSPEHGPGGHGPMPPSSLQIGPNDSATLFVPIYALSPSNYRAGYSIRIKDESGNAYITKQFNPCVL